MPVAKQILAILNELEQLLAKFADGTVDPGDLDHVNDLISRLNDFMAGGIQSLIDDPKEQEILAMILMAIGAAKPFLYWQVMKGK